MEEKEQLWEISYWKENRKKEKNSAQNGRKTARIAAGFLFDFFLENYENCKMMFLQLLS